MVLFLLEVQTQERTTSVAVFAECRGALRVVFNSSHSFNLSWSDSLMNASECYTVEWFPKAGDGTAAFKSFYSSKNHSTIDIGEGTYGH